ncbi:unnamed protein product, partial [Vitis vinifera]
MYEYEKYFLFYFLVLLPTKRLFNLATNVTCLIGLIAGYSFGYWFSEYLESLRDGSTFSSNGVRERYNYYYHYETALYLGKASRVSIII